MSIVHKETQYIVSPILTPKTNFSSKRNNSNKNINLLCYILRRHCFFN